MSEAANLARLIDWSCYDERALLTSRPGGIGAALWRLDNNARVELEATIPDDTHMLCVH